MNDKEFIVMCNSYNGGRSDFVKLVQWAINRGAITRQELAHRTNTSVFAVDRWMLGYYIPTLHKAKQYLSTLSDAVCSKKPPKITDAFGICRKCHKETQLRTWRWADDTCSTRCSDCGELQ